MLLTHCCGSDKLLILSARLRLQHLTVIVTSVATRSDCWPFCPVSHFNLCRDPIVPLCQCHPEVHCEIHHELDICLVILHQKMQFADRNLKKCAHHIRRRLRSGSPALVSAHGGNPNCHDYRENTLIHKRAIIAPLHCKSKFCKNYCLLTDNVRY